MNCLWKYQHIVKFWVLFTLVSAYVELLYNPFKKVVDFLGVKDWFCWKHIPVQKTAMFRKACHSSLLLWKKWLAIRYTPCSIFHCVKNGLLPRNSVMHYKVCMYVCMYVWMYVCKGWSKIDPALALWTSSYVVLLLQGKWHFIFTFYLLQNPKSLGQHSARWYT